MPRVLKKLRVLVCGDRNWTDYDLIYSALSQSKSRIGVVIEGEARGADTLARKAAEELGIKVEAYPADWEKYGKAAGPIRNKQMLVEGKPDWVIAFHDSIDESKGTANMVALAHKAGIPYAVISHEGVAGNSLICRR